ncbi:MAG TPA: hypothetical protein VM841_09660, partial [Actinomycetota bacterium]|nr:hypothetical protein [Actinomycetota bacterium]
GYTFEAATIAKFVMSDVYQEFDQSRSRERKMAMLDAAGLIVDKIKKGVDPVKLASALASSAHRKRIQVWMRDEAPQRAVAALGVSGSFRPAASGTTMIGVVTQNAGANKLDYYLRREIDIQIRLREDGSASAAVKVTLRNSAPASGLTREVMGPANVPDGEVLYRAGRNVSFLNVYLPAAAARAEWSEAGKPVGTEIQAAPDALIVSRFIDVAPGGSAETTLTFELPAGSWDEGRVRLLVPRQPAAAADALTVRIFPPEGLTAGGSDQFEVSKMMNRDILVETHIGRPWTDRLKQLVWR